MTKKQTREPKSLKVDRRSPEQRRYDEANERYQAAWKGEVQVAEKVAEAERALLEIKASELTGLWARIKAVFVGPPEAMSLYLSRRDALVFVRRGVEWRLFEREEAYQDLIASRF